MLMPELWTVSPISEAEWPCYRRFDTMSLLLLLLVVLLLLSLLLLLLLLVVVKQ